MKELTVCKRRCIHDDTGNVDPVKAAETPVPRGSVASKKRRMTEGGESPQAAKKLKAEPYHQPTTPFSAPQQRPRPDSGVHLANAGLPVGPAFRPNMMSSTTATSQAPPSQDHPQIDPSLFSMYPEPPETSSSTANGHPYHAMDKQESYNSYILPSLEQIANEVLDMNGRHNDYDQNHTDQDQHFVNHFIEASRQADSTAYHSKEPHGLEKQDDSVDSAISVPGTEELVQRQTKVHAGSVAAYQRTPAEPTLTNGYADDGVAHAEQAAKPSATPVMHHELPPQPSLEPSQENVPAPTSPLTQLTTSPATSKSFINKIPLYQPPAQPAAKPPVPLTNGNDHAANASPPPANSKRKRDSKSATPGANSVKKAKTNGVEREMSPDERDEDENLRLARMLQQEDLGLRRRSKS